MPAYILRLLASLALATAGSACSSSKGGGGDSGNSSGTVNTNASKSSTNNAVPAANNAAPVTVSTEQPVPTDTQLLQQVFPAPQATGVTYRANVIEADFTESMVGGSLTNATFSVMAGGLPIAGAVAYSTSSSGTFSAILRPAMDLKPNTLYTATVAAGVQAVSGHKQATGYTWTFTTAK